MSDRCAHCGDKISDHYGTKCSKCPCGSNVPSPEQQARNEWDAQVQAERQRQRGKGYDAAHDAEHGIDHLLMWAQDYARRGEPVKSTAMIEAARELLSSYPLGEGQTPKLDPKPWHSFATPPGLDEGYRSARQHLNDAIWFDPRPQYSQNREDYE